MNEKLLLYKLRSLDDDELALVARYVRYLHRQARIRAYIRKVITRILALFNPA
jgi:hypothetical protein